MNSSPPIFQSVTRSLSPLLALLGLAGAVSAALVAPVPKEDFETDFTLDAVLARGNTENGEIGSKIETEGATPYFDSIRAGASFAYGESRADSVRSITANRWEIFGNARRPWDPNRTYTFADGKFQRDSVADLHFRSTQGGGMGWYLDKAESLEWTVDTGLSWIFEETSDGSDNYPAFRLSERYERQWVEGPKVSHKLEVLPHAFQLDNFLLNADVGLETVISAVSRLRALLEYRYQSRPPDDTKSYDLRLVLGVTWKM
ncbi:MAG: DUF481 domain-containing protein [Kiritimatiellia bacterium]